MDIAIIGKATGHLEIYEETQESECNLDGDMCEVDLSDVGNAAPELFINQVNQEYQAPVNSNQNISQTNETIFLPSSTFRRIVCICFGVFVLALILGSTAKISQNNNEDTSESFTQFDEASFVTENHISSQVVQQGWSNPDLLADPQSPQSKAVRWLAQHDTLFDEAADATTVQERYAMVVFYFSLGGPEWYQGGLNFLQPNVHICEWFQILSFKEANVVQSFRFGIDCTCENLNPLSTRDSCSGDHPTVKRLVLANMNLNGQLPEEIRLLNELIELDLNHNSISGSLSDGLFAISNLQRLVLSNNAFGGPFPTWLPGLRSELRFLDISHNDFEGEIPSTIADLSLLQVLNANYNNLKGSLSVFGKMKNLSAVFLRGDGCEPTPPSSPGEEDKVPDPKEIKLGAAGMDLGINEEVTPLANPTGPKQTSEALTQTKGDPEKRNDIFETTGINDPFPKGQTSEALIVSATALRQSSFFFLVQGTNQNQFLPKVEFSLE